MSVHSNLLSALSSLPELKAEEWAVPGFPLPCEMPLPTPWALFPSSLFYPSHPTAADYTTYRSQKIQTQKSHL